MSCHIRPGTPSDLPQVLAIASAGSDTGPRWTEAHYQAALAPNTDREVLLVEEGAVTGFVVLHYIAGECEIENIAVALPCRGRGVGTVLLRAAMDAAAARNAERMLLEVRASNVAALALYERFGFRRDGLRTDYFDAPREDAVLMAVALSAP